MADKKFSLFGIMSVLHKDGTDIYGDGKEYVELLDYMTRGVDPRATSGACQRALLDACERLLRQRYPKLAKTPPLPPEDHAGVWIAALSQKFGSSLAVNRLSQEVIDKILEQTNKK